MKKFEGRDALSHVRIRKTKPDAEQRVPTGLGQCGWRISSELQEVAARNHLLLNGLVQVRGWFD